MKVSSLICLLMGLTVHHGQTTAVADEWREALGQTNASRALLHIKGVRDKDAKREVCSQPLGINGDTPVLHHMLNMYFRSRDVGARKDLVQLMLHCVDAGVTVEEPFGSDPSVLFKALAMREMNLARALAAASGAPLATRLLLTHLYSLPCELVPLAKLLLHANTIVSRNAAGLAGFGGVEGVKRLVASASLGAQSKPAVKGDDLAALSVVFTNLVAAFGSSDYRLSLTQLIAVLDEVAGTTHQHLLTAPSLSETLAVLQEAESAAEGSLRNGLHHLGIAGATHMIGQLAEAAKAAAHDGEPGRAALEALAQALGALDVHGMAPASYALARFGPQSEAFLALLSLCQALPLQLLDVCDVDHPAALVERARGKAERRAGVEREVGVTGVALQPPEEDYVGGGWDAARLDPELAGDAGRCDIVEVHGPPPSRSEFYRDYVLTSTPVVFRGAARGQRLERAFERGAFLKAYGNDQVDVGAIPYPSSFGVPGQRVTMRAVAEMQQAEEKGSSSASSFTANYAFSTAPPAWQQRLWTDAPLPSFVPLAGQQNAELQFYLGPGGSGAPMHFHGHAVNSLAYGEKRWFLLPPADAYYSTLSAAQFVREGHGEAAAQCTQRSGDILFVPSLWSHATLNLRQTIGVAHEFSLEPFCMS